MTPTKPPRADVSEIVAAFAKHGPRAVVMKMHTLEVTRRRKVVQVAVTREMLLRALSSYALLRPDEQVLAQDLADFVRMHRRQRRAKNTLPITWRGSSTRPLRPVVSVPLSDYSERLDISPPEPDAENSRAQTRHSLNVEFLPDKIIIHTRCLSSDSGDWVSSSESEPSESE